MWFKVLSFIVALACLTKGIVALARPARFCARRRQQLSAGRIPRAILVVSSLVVAMMAVTWHATLFHYAPWGWILTTFITVLSFLSMLNVLRWSTSRIRMLAFVEYAEQNWHVDAAIITLGVIFLTLAIFVYPS
jgi:hypothetical protein